VDVEAELGEVGGDPLLNETIRIRGLRLDPGER
jgi:hypothetical protein